MQYSKIFDSMQEICSKKIDEPKNFGVRLQCLMERVGAENASELAKRLKTTRQNVSNWMEREEPTDTALSKILLNLPEVNADWLRTGRGEMFAGREGAPAEEGAARTDTPGIEELRRKAPRGYEGMDELTQWEEQEATERQRKSATEERPKAEGEPDSGSPSVTAPEWIERSNEVDAATPASPTSSTQHLGRIPALVISVMGRPLLRIDLDVQNTGLGPLDVSLDVGLD